MNKHLERGDPIWKARGYGKINKLGCPENSTPLWQAVNPFTDSKKIDKDMKRSFYHYVAGHERTREYIKESPIQLVGLMAVIFSDEKPTKAQIKNFRITVYEILPDYIKNNLREEVERKYSHLSQDRTKRPAQSL